MFQYEFPVFCVILQSKRTKEMMKKLLLLFFFTCLFAPVSADEYSALWKQVENAREKDQPKTMIQVLDKIEQKASLRGDYGTLLSAVLMRSTARLAVSPDSLDTEIRSLEAKEQKAGDVSPVLQAVYESVLGRICEQNADYASRQAYQDKSKRYYALSMSRPDLLATTKADAYVPLIAKGSDSKIFGDDLLHVLGLQAGDFATLLRYYAQTGNRAAVCIVERERIRHAKNAEGATLDHKGQLRQVDSLIAVYADIPEAGALAVERFRLMNAGNASAKEKYEWLNHAINTWGTWTEMNTLRNELKDLTNSSAQVLVGDRVATPNRPVDIKLKYMRNLPNLRLDITRLKVNAQQIERYNGKDEWRKLKVKGSTMTLTRRYQNHKPYELYEDSVTINGLPAGIYIVEARAEGEKTDAASALLYVSDARLIVQQMQDSLLFVAVSATTGAPLPNAKIRLKRNWWDKEDVFKEFTTNGKGELMCEEMHLRRMMVYTEDDAFSPYVDAYTTYTYAPNRTRTMTRIMTDRAIYRPGQTVQVAAMVYKGDGLEHFEAEPKKEVTLRLLNANYKEVGKKVVTTDEFGTAAADFTLPSTGLMGVFHIRTAVGNGNVSFRVEEYKRPTFDVAFDDLKEQYAEGDTIDATGKAKTYSGVPVQGGRVSYTVRREPAYWWRFWNGEGSQVVFAATDTTAADGSFKVRVPLVMKGDNPGQPRFYRFVVSAQVTDGNGESHYGEIAVPVGSRPTAFGCNLPAKVLSDSLTSITFDYKNNAGNDLDGEVTFAFDNGEMWKAKANMPVALSTRLASGRHILRAMCGNDTLRQEVIVFALEDSTPVVKTDDWFYQSDENFGQGKPVYIQIGSSDPDQYILYTIFSQRKLLEKGVIKQSNAICTRRFDYQKAYGDGLRITYAWYKDGKMHKHSASIGCPAPDKKLALKWSTFRDRLTPGQKEEWTLTVGKKDGKANPVQLMAVLYDKSLDALLMHDWNFALGKHRAIPYTEWSGNYSSMIYMMVTQTPQYFKNRGIGLSHFDEKWFEGFTSPSLSMGTFKFDRPRKAGQKVIATMMAKEANSVAPTAESMAMADAASTEENSADSNDGMGTSSVSVQMRENLNETAFFYPSLVSDENHQFHIRFTLPESVTTWKFMGLAHDREMNYGQMRSEVVASKPVMVQPNVPRFLREGDEASIAVRISNTTKQTQKGRACLEIMDPASGKTILFKKENFVIGPEVSKVVNFELAHLGEGVYVVKAIAEGKTFNDGEQHYLPVLSNRELVINSYPFTLNGKGKKELSVEMDRGGKMSFAYTANPAWLMVQALPSVASPTQQDAFSVATAYYANAISQLLIKHHPVLRSVVEAWMREPGQPAMQSPLTQNEDLKRIVLDETPWVMDADKETEQRKRLANYFDENLTKQRIDHQRELLEKLQLADGSFAWWPGMEGNRSMTTAIGELFARLAVLMGDRTPVAHMLDNCLKYLAKETADEVAEMKRMEKKGVKDIAPSESALRYLYMLSLDSANAKSARMQDVNYLISKCHDARLFTIYGKAKMAVVFARNGQGQRADDFVRSLKEYLTGNDDMGLYYDTRKAVYSWFDYKIPTEVAAIEALRLLDSSDTATIGAMQRWLLQEKRTQAWDTPLNTVEAVYAFLSGNHALEAKVEMPNVTIDGKKQQLNTPSVGVGYTNTTLPVMSNGKRKLSVIVDKKNTGTAWGAVFTQFTRSTADIASAASGLSVTREINVEADGVQANTINDGAERLRVGDRVVVRLTIQADRDYDFVQVRDHRAACLEPVNQLSGYHGGYYEVPRDNATDYFFDRMAKGRHVVETTYYVDRMGNYQMGSCSVECAYSPEFSGRAASGTLKVKP